MCLVDMEKAFHSVPKKHGVVKIIQEALDRPVIRDYHYY